jgi:hypothetical protein
MRHVYEVFSDESHHRDSQFRAIAAVSLPKKIVPSVQKDLAGILADSDVSEFKWNELTSARFRFCALKLVDYLIDKLIPNGTRVDALIWDVHDDRHRVFGRDDTKNLERMYFHLHKNLITRRPRESEWQLWPDQQFEVDWDIIQDCLRSVGSWQEYWGSLFPGDLDWKRLYSLRSLEPVPSHECPLTQLADLLAGMGPYTRLRADRMKGMLRDESRQTTIWDEQDTDSPSKADDERFCVVRHLHRRCRKQRLGLSFRSTGYLRTPDPRNPINFWHYEPQHEEDKAPTREA